MYKKLTKTERRILELSAKGHSQLAIAEILSIASGTVYFHTANIYAKLGVHNILAALSAVGEWDWTE